MFLFGGENSGGQLKKEVAIRGIGRQQMPMRLHKMNNGTMRSAEFLRDFPHRPAVFGEQCRQRPAHIHEFTSAGFCLQTSLQIRDIQRLRQYGVIEILGHGAQNGQKRVVRQGFARKTAHNASYCV